ncbi:hypothetical protein LWI29_000447 [Acer saccharum]|uniref:Uncharacterized protein n=1 Tax=Acer saccharum TaxID=4024 RepID=A0AA39RBH3_ACESA|nr:hypothetical protein LWI29_000447 [Acer saccharum]
MVSAELPRTGGEHLGSVTGQLEVEEDTFEKEMLEEERGGHAEKLEEVVVREENPPKTVKIGSTLAPKHKAVLQKTTPTGRVASDIPPKGVEVSGSVPCLENMNKAETSVYTQLGHAPSLGNVDGHSVSAPASVPDPDSANTPGPKPVGDSIPSIAVGTSGPSTSTAGPKDVHDEPPAVPVGPGETFEYVSLSDFSPT